MTGCLYRFRQKIGEKGLLEHIAYSDKWGAGNKHYLDFMKKVFEHVYNLLTRMALFICMLIIGHVLT